MMRCLALAIAPACIGLSAAAHGAMVALAPAQDNTLVQGAVNPEDDGFLSNGAGNHFFAGTIGTGFARRGVIAFDVAGAVPQGSTINMVILHLHMSRTRAGATDIALHPLLASWGEGDSQAMGEEGAGAIAAPGDATWRHRFHDDIFWTNPGGDFAHSASATTQIGNIGHYQWSSTQMTSDVQAWVNDPSSNFGWILIGDESMPQTAKRFDTRENSVAEFRPVLIIDFTPPGDVGACCVPNGSCILMTGAQCAAMDGLYQGDGSECSPNPCPEPTGACCLPSGDCDVLTEAECLDAGGGYRGNGTDCADVPCPPEAFVDALPIPAVAQPVEGEPGGAATYRIAMVEVEQQFHRDLPPTRVWTYDGFTPGPIIEARTDEPVVVEWVNDLRDFETGELRTEHYLPVDPCPHGPGPGVPEPRAIVHLHGGVVTPEADGYPEWTILPGESVEYDYPNIQAAGMLWFHDHALGTTRLNVYMGLAGLYLIRDDIEDSLNLPSGPYEVPLVIQDRSIDRETGELIYPETVQDHFFGELILVNGKVWPYFNVDRGMYRFRILNGSNSRAYTLSLSDGAPFQHIATDVGLAPAPVELTELTLTSGERAEIVVDFSGYEPGTEIVLRNSAPSPFPGAPGVGVVPNVMKFIVGEAPGHAAPLPETLAPFEPLDPAESVITRDFTLRLFPGLTGGHGGGGGGGGGGGHGDRGDHGGGHTPESCENVPVWLINGLVWDDIVEFPVLNTVEVWRFINRSGITHPMHMHLVHFQVLQRQNFEVIGDTVVTSGPPIPPRPEEIGWKDTVQAHPNQIVSVIARFGPFLGVYPYHCHILEHEDHEMMRQFVVVPPPCPADLTGNRQVGSHDLATLLGQWGGPGSGDLSGDGVVGAPDLAALMAQWGPCP